MTYRGAIHLHSTYSYDGKLSLPELKDFLLDRGVSFACMSEHTDEMTPAGAKAFVAECRALSDEEFVFVPGFEVPYERAHILMLGCTQFFGQVAETTEALHAWSAASALTILAHPIRNRFVVDDEMLSVLDGVEIWNQQYEGKWLPRTKSAQLLTELRIKRPELLALGGVDFHRPEHFGAPFTTVELATLSEVRILERLYEGAYVFGTNELEIEGEATWKPTISERPLSRVAIIIIDLGKFANKILASLGLSLPKSLKQKIRSYV